MVILRSVDDVIQQREIFQDIRAAGCMGFHRGVLVVRQPGRLVQDTVRNTDLADIMHLGRPFDILALLFRQSVSFSNLF